MKNGYGFILAQAPMLQTCSLGSEFKHPEEDVSRPKLEYEVRIFEGINKTLMEIQNIYV